MLDQTKPDALAEMVLGYIRKSSKKEWPISKICKRFSVEPAQLESALSILQVWGYRLKRTKDAVRFMAAPDLITPTEIAFGLKTKRFGKTLHSYQSVKSTNDLAASLAESGASEGTIVTSEEQTKGRGRFARNWHSPPGTGIYVSIILRPSFGPDQAPGLSIMTAVALAETLEAYCPGKVRIKWPNDVLLHRRKTAGILTELSAESGKINHVIVGVGINVNQTAADFPAELRAIAISVRRVIRRKTDRVKLLREFLAHFEKRYRQYEKDRLKSMHRLVRRYSSLLGHNIRLASGKEITEGIVKDIDKHGALIVQTAHGIKSITSGEVTVIKERQ